LIRAVIELAQSHEDFDFPRQTIRDVDAKVDLPWVAGTGLKPVSPSEE
jgi:hypothetical protein